MERGRERRWRLILVMQGFNSVPFLFPLSFSLPLTAKCFSVFVPEIVASVECTIQSVPHFVGVIGAAVSAS